MGPAEAQERPRKRAGEAKRVEEDRREVDRILLPLSQEHHIRLAAATLHPGTRKWLFEEVDEWWASDSRLLILEGAPGTGKTTFLGALCATRPDIVKASFFCMRHDRLRRDARWLVRSVASQLARELPAVRGHLLGSGITCEELEDASSTEMCAELLREPLEAAGEPEAGEPLAKLALVIDDADGSHDLRRILELCFDSLPEQVVFLVAARRGQCSASPAMSRLHPRVLAVDRGARYAEDIAALAREAVLGLVPPGQGPAQAAALQRKVCGPRGGGLLHAGLARPLLARCSGRLPAERLSEALPDTAEEALGAYLGPLLRAPQPSNVLAAATRSLLLAAVAGAAVGGHLPAGKGAAELVHGCPAAAVPLACAALAVVFPAVDGHLVPAHQAVLQWFQGEDRPEQVRQTLLGAHAALGRMCLAMLQQLCEAQRACRPVPEGGPAQHYAVEHGLRHVWAAGGLLTEDERLYAEELMFDARYVRAKCHHAPREYQWEEWLEAAQQLPELARPLRLLRSALFVSTDAVRQMPAVHVCEQVWDRIQKAVVARSCGMAPRAPQPSAALADLMRRVVGLIAEDQDYRRYSMLGPLLDASDHGLVAMLTGHTQWVMSLATYQADDGTPRLVSGGEGAFCVWHRVEEGHAPLRRLEGHADHVRALAPYRLADGAWRLASGSSDGTVRIWDPESAGEALHVADGAAGPGRDDWVRGLAAFAARDGTLRLASGSSDGTVRVWTLEADEARQVRTLRGHERMVMKVAAYGSGALARVVSGASDRTIRVWDPEVDGPALRVLEGHRHWVTALEAFEDAGRPRLASGCMDSTLYVWDPEAGGAPLLELEGHQDCVCEVSAFSAAGRLRLASSSADRTVHLWDPRTGQALARLEGHGHTVRSLVAFPGADGSPRLASGSDDRTIRVWQAEV